MLFLFVGSVRCWAGISATLMMRSLIVIIELELTSVYEILRASLCWPKL